MRNAISNLISSGQTETLLPHIYYEAAQKYAVDCGASLSPYKNDPENDSLVFEVKTASHDRYSVYISKWHDGSTYLSVENKSSIKINDVIDDINTQKFGEAISEQILTFVKNKDQAHAVSIQLLLYAEIDYIHSFMAQGVFKVANDLDLDLSKYSIDFKKFYLRQKEEFERKEREKYAGNALDYDPSADTDPRLSGIDLFETTAAFKHLTLEVKDPEKCLEIKFFVIDSIMKKWKLY